MAAFLGWLLPGLGHLYAGRPAKAFWIFLGIVPTYALGLWLTDFTAVSPRERPFEFIAHAFALGPSALAIHIGEGRLLDSMPRWHEVGRLYAAVASLLNLVAACDAVEEVLQRNGRIDAEEVARLPRPTLLPEPGEAVHPAESPAPDGLLERNGQPEPPVPPPPLAGEGLEGRPVRPGEGPVP
jgi:hypothetical protein